MQDMKRLRWQCRRGVKELDAVLSAYLDGHYAAAGPEDQSLFRELLLLEDDFLIACFFADSAPEQAGLKRIVDKIKCSFVD